jgi:hypothetical protein
VSERQPWIQELGELPSQIVEYQRELDATRVESKERRERLQWQIRRDEKRMVELEARLAPNGR